MTLPQRAPHDAPLSATGGGGHEPPAFPDTGEAPPEILTEGELRLVFRALGSDRDRAIVLVSYFCALRIVEACDLRLEHFDRAAGTLRIYQRKVKKWRVAPLHPQAATALERYVRLSRPAEPGPLFLSRKGGRITPNACWRFFRAACTDAGIPLRKAHTHVLRASRATHLLVAGATIGQVQDCLGHASPRTTTRYLRAAPGWASSLLVTGDAL